MDFIITGGSVGGNGSGDEVAKRPDVLRKTR